VKPYSIASRGYPVLRRAAVLLAIVSVGVAAAGCGQGPGTTVLSGTFVSPTNQCGVPAEAEQYATRVFELVNEERASQGLAPLTTNSVLADMAGSYACEMVEGGFFDHNSPITGSTLGSRALQAGYYFKKVGENLAGGQTSPEQAMSEWMASPGHKENILNEDFVEMGTVVRTGGHYGWYWVQEFGQPR
jgi:uncharacterized protein YkwD